jgi:serine/threonine protein kinase
LFNFIHLHFKQKKNRVDIWCLGITVYNMTYGVTPFEAPEGSKDWQKVTMHNIQFKQLNFIESKRVKDPDNVNIYIYMYTYICVFFIL